MSDVTGISVTDLLGLSEPLTKLIDVCSSAIGTVYKPIHERKMTDAKVYEIKQIGEAIRDNIDLPVNYQYRNIGINATDAEDLAQRAKNRWLCEEMRRQQNVEAVAENAYNEMLGKEKVSDAPVDEDWKTRFFNIAKDISSEEMQRIWGKILAGEVENPGSFSMRTLDTIRNLSKAEAQVFQKIMPHIVQFGSIYMIYSANELMKKYGINYSDILILNECGLVDANAITYNPVLKKGESRVIHNTELLALVQGTTETPSTVSISAYILTNAGRELFSILSCEPNCDAFIDFSENVFKSNMSKVEISVHKYLGSQDGFTHYNTSTIRVFKKIKAEANE